MPLHCGEITDQGTECIRIGGEGVAFLHGVFAKGRIRTSEGASIPLKCCSFLAIPEWEAGSASSADSLLLPRVFFQFHNCGIAMHYLRDSCKVKFTNIKVKKQYLNLANFSGLSRKWEKKRLVQNKKSVCVGSLKSLCLSCIQFYYYATCCFCNIACRKVLMHTCTCTEE